MTATEELRRLLDERGVEWDTMLGHIAVVGTEWSDKRGNPCTALEHADDVPDGMLSVQANLTPEQAVAATLGPVPLESPMWERWHKSLRHDEVKTIGDAVEQLMYEAIEFGGDMGPNGNVWNGIDEGDVLTNGFINEWVERFENMLGPGTCKDATSEEHTQAFTCSECGCWVAYDEYWETGIYVEGEGQAVHIHPHYCPNCGRKVEA